MLPGKDTSLPLDKIFIKSRLDLLTAKAWLAENPPGMVSQIVDLSIATGEGARCMCGEAGAKAGPAPNPIPRRSLP